MSGQIASERRRNPQFNRSEIFGADHDLLHHAAEMCCSTRDAINNVIDPAERAAFLARKAELFTRIAQDTEQTRVDDYSRQVRQMATDARTAAEQAQFPQQQVGPDPRGRQSRGDRSLSCDDTRPENGGTGTALVVILRFSHP